jgi:hypothetical protein
MSCQETLTWLSQQTLIRKFKSPLKSSIIRGNSAGGAEYARQQRRQQRKNLNGNITLDAPGLSIG